MAIVSANGAATPLSPNYIINGAFDVWQRGAGPFTTNVYGADRWQFYGTGTGTSHSATRQSFTPGSASLVGQESQYYYRDVITSGSDASTQMLMVQKIEDVRTLAGQTVEFSFWAKAGSGTPRIGVEMYQNFGSGGSDAVSGIGQSVTISTSWARYSFTITVPSVSGKTIGPDSSLQAIIWFSAGSTNATRSGSVGLQSGTFDIWGAQLEAGSIATPFRRNSPSLQAELAACQRYYEKSYDLSTSPGTATNVSSKYSAANGVTTTTSYLADGISFRVTKRAIPIMTSWDLSGNINKVNRENWGVSSNSNQASSISISGTNNALIFSSGTVAAHGISYHWSADAEL